MRKIVYGGAISFDGYLAREDGSVDWLIDSPGSTELLKETWPRFDAMLMGRKTYEIALKMSPGQDASSVFGNMRAVVFSRTLEPTSRDGYEIVGDNAVEFARSMKSEDGKDIMLMGGGELANSLLNAGLVDEIGFNVQPILLGSGVSAFHQMPTQIGLELKECRQLGSGCVYLSYDVKN
jgi:dihydrofolate reductase